MLVGASLSDLQRLKLHALSLPHSPHIHAYDSSFTQPEPQSCSSHLYQHYQLQMLHALKSLFILACQPPISSVHSIALAGFICSFDKY